VREQLASYPRLPFYQRMLRAAGFAEVANNTWSDRMIDAVVLWGNEARVEERLRELMRLGAMEVLVSPVVAGSNRTMALDRTMRLLGRMAQAVAKA
jgi:hypothetical protein